MLAGTLDASTADTVSSTGNVSSSGSNVGGLFGRSICSSVITNSSAGADATGITNVGGLSGRDIGGSAGFGDCSGAGHGSTITDSSASGNISGSDYTGGFIGAAYDTTLTRTHATGYAHGNDNVGGLIGYYNQYSSYKITASYATGAVAGRYSLGGLVGFMQGGEVSQSFSSGAVSSTAGDDMGGLIGRAVLGTTVTIRNSYSRSSVNTGTGADSGSIVGYGMSYVQIINSYGTGTITTSACGGGLHGCGDLGTVTNTFWDTQTTGKSSACGSGTCGGTGKTTAEMKTKSTFTDAGWDFTDIWGIDSSANNGYPYLLASLSFICEMPQVTANTLRFKCDLSHLGTTVDSSSMNWQARYKKVGDAGWTNVDIDDATKGTMIFRNLDSSTDYQLSLKPSSTTFVSWASTTDTTLNVNSDVDGDGTKDIVENAGPNGGDVDNNGVLDALESHSASLSNSVSGAYSTLATDCVGVNSISAQAESSSYKDAGYDYAAGLLAFTASGCGSVATFTQYFFGNYDTAKLVARKYNSTTHAYTTIPGAVLTNATIGGQPALKIVYQITDNSALDESPIVGTITDPSGPGLLAVGAPNTGLELVQ